MSFVLEYLSHLWDRDHNNDEKSLKEWQTFLDVAEKDRQRDRIISWRDRTMYDDYAANANEPIIYRRTAGFVWRYEDPTGTTTNRNHTYMYNLKTFGHKLYSRRDPKELEAAAQAVAQKVQRGELGGLSPLE